MKFNEKRFNRIIEESINKYINEIEQMAVGGTDRWEDWATTDAKNGLTPEEGKQLRMQGRGVNRAFDSEMERRGDTVKKQYNVNPPSYNDWKNNFSNMPYGVYAEKRKNGEL